MKSATKFILISAAICFVQGVSAAVLVEYDFDSSSIVASSSETGLTPSAFDDGPGWTATFQTLSSDVFRAVQVAQTPSTFDANDYFEFSVTPDVGTTLNLTSLTFDGVYLNGAVGPVDYFVRSSLDNFSVDIDMFTLSNTATFTPYSVDLTGTSFQNLSTAVSFRIYIADSSNSSSTTRYSGIDDVILNGTAVPEPSTYLLIAVNVAILMVRRFCMTGSSS